MVSPANIRQGNFHKDWAFGGVGHLVNRHIFFSEKALNEGGAGLCATGSHAGTGDRFDLVDIAVSLADQGADLAGSDMFAAANDRVICRHDGHIGAWVG